MDAHSDKMFIEGITAGGFPTAKEEEISETGLKTMFYAWQGK